MKMHNPPHPGKKLKALYLEPLGLSITEAAEGLDMPRSALSEIVNGKRAISVTVAVKLGKAFSTTPKSWLNAQMKYDLWQLEQQYTADEIKPIVAKAQPA